ncbi:hypothetical protein B0H14DRAFT_3528293 [Mycena olivaceomarginata]|nr:hypothetical protein B0H14DRAFT_3528293 [Mycena olivaceomarginata]
MPDLSRLSLQEAAPEAESHGSVSLPSSPVSPPPLSATTTVSSASSVTVTTWASVPELARYFAIWGGWILYVKKYGYHLADDQDLAEDVEDPPDEAVDEVVHDVMSPEEQEFCAQYTKKPRIGAWYRAQYGSLLQSDKTAFQELFTGVLDGAPPKPQRGRLLHFYSRKFYDSRIKEDAEERMVSLTRRAELAGEAAPKRIDVIAKLAMEREHQQALKGWEASLSDSPTRTAEEITVSFANTAFYLQPFIDAIQQQFGMCVTVLLAGPIGEWDGKIVWGYDEGSWKMATKYRPRQVTGWLNRGRKWTMPPALGGLLGRREATGQAEELWVGLFWAWWRMLQPDERAELRNRELS